jgi:hypothetical protein
VAGFVRHDVSHRGSRVAQEGQPSRFAAPSARLEKDPGGSCADPGGSEAGFVLALGPFPLRVQHAVALGLKDFLWAAIASAWASFLGRSCSSPARTPRT